MQEEKGQLKIGFQKKDWSNIGLKRKCVCGGERERETGKKLN